MQPPTGLREVRFKVYHQGMGADIGDCLHVPEEWARRAIDAGIVEDLSGVSHADRADSGESADHGAGKPG
jgi:hypothetical protein